MQFRKEYFLIFYRSDHNSGYTVLKSNLCFNSSKWKLTKVTFVEPVLTQETKYPDVIHDSYE